jgi:hypothetical protein
MFKFLLGAPAGVAAQLNFFETYLLMILGMMVSVSFVAYGGSFIFSNFRTRRKKIFSKYSRLIVRFWRLFGIWGIAFLTPPLLTPIGGTLVALGFKVNPNKIVFSMAISAVIWGFILCFFTYIARDFVSEILK